MIYFIYEDKYVIRLKQWIEKADFIKLGKVLPGSYAEELLGRIYDCLITYSVNIVDEYQKYYIEEYSSLESFLYWKYGINESIVASITNGLGSGEFLGYSSVNAGGDYNIGQFVGEGSNLDAIKTIIEGAYPRED